MWTWRERSCVVTNFVSGFLGELHNIAMFFETILLVGFYTGGAVAVLIAFGYELQTKRRS